MTQHIGAIETWLCPLDKLPLECDGLTRVISTLLQRDGVEHQAMVGALEIAGVGRIPLHWWIELPGGEVIDFRARMWLQPAEKVPHGVFEKESTMDYRGSPVDATLSPIVFSILANKSLEQVDAYSPPARPSPRRARP